MNQPNPLDISGLIDTDAVAEMLSYLAEENEHGAYRMLTAFQAKVASQAIEIERLREVLSIIADEQSWRGFSAMPIVERMRELARATLEMKP